MGIIEVLESNIPFNYGTVKDKSLESHSILHTTQFKTGELLHLMVHANDRIYTLARTADFVNGKSIPGFTIRDLDCLDYEDRYDGLVEALTECTVEHALHAFIEYLVSKGV